MAEFFEVGVIGGWLFGGRGICQHFPGGVAASGDEFLDDFCFGQVLPIFLGHLGLHRFYLEAGGVEDVAVVGFPKLFEGVRVGGLGFVNTVGEVNFLAVPVHAFVRGENGPIHAGEAFAKEGGGEAHDAMFGFEPGDELLAIGFRCVIDFSESDKGVHLMNVAPDVLGHRSDAMNLRVRGKREEMSFAVRESPEKGVEECPLISRAMAGDGSGEVDKGLGDSGEISGAWGQWCFREKSELFAALPKKILWWDSSSEEASCYPTPVVEVFGMDEGSHRLEFSSDDFALGNGRGEIEFQLLRGRGMESSDFFGIQFECGGLMVAGDHEGEAFFQIDPHLDEVVHADVMKAAGRDDPFGIPHSEARDA